MYSLGFSQTEAVSLPLGGVCAFGWETVVPSQRCKKEEPEHGTASPMEPGVSLLVPGLALMETLGFTLGELYVSVSPAERGPL